MKRHSLLLLLLAGIGTFYLIWGSSDTIGDLFGDGTNYLMLAGHFSLYGHWDVVHDGMGRVSRFPPGYPLLLALFDASMNLRRAHIITTLCLLPALTMLYRWLLEQGFGRTQAALLILLIAVLPQTWRQDLRIQSEFLYVFLSLLALLLMQRLQKTGNAEGLYLAAIAVSASIVTREVGLSLLPALLLCLRRVSLRSAIIAIGIATLPVIDWHCLHSGPVTYGGVLDEAYGGDFFRQLRDQLLVELPALRLGFCRALWNGDVPFMPADLLGALCLAATLWRLALLKLDAIYIVANLAILLIWPYPEEAARFLWVLLPLLLVQPVLLLAHGVKQDASAPIPRALCGCLAAIVLMMALPGLSFAAGRFRDGAWSAIPDARSYLPWYENGMRFAQFDAGIQSAVVDVLQRAQAIIPEGDCLFASRIDVAAYFSRRRSFYWPTAKVPDAEFDQRLQARGCHYALVYFPDDRKYPITMYPLARIEGRSDVVLQGWLPRARESGSKPVCILLKLRAVPDLPSVSTDRH